jgi:hypothetical protein
MRVFGSARTRPDEARDLDLCLVLPGPVIHNSPEMDALTHFLGAARARLGWLDCFALIGRALMVRNPDASDWVNARHAKALKEAIAEGEPFATWYDRVVRPRCEPEKCVSVARLPVPVADPPVPNAVELAALATQIQAHLDPAWLQPAYRAQWSPANPTLGFCAIAAEAAFFRLGGAPAGWVAWAVRESADASHWWLEHRSGLRFDPTADQFHRQGQVPPYERGLPGKPCGFQGMRQDPNSPYGFGRRPSARAQALLDALAAGPTAVPAPPRRRRGPGPR